MFRAPPLAAAKRLAKLCQDTKPLFKHKAFLFPSIHAVPTCRTALSAPLVSKHLKGRRARGDSYSSSSSESTGHTSNKMARQLGSMYDTLQGGISRLTEDLASSLHLEKTSSNNVAGYITSPSATSTYSNHSLFSEQSHISSHTNHSSRQASDSDHCRSEMQLHIHQLSVFYHFIITVPSQRLGNHTYNRHRVRIDSLSIICQIHARL